MKNKIIKIPLVTLIVLLIPIFLVYDAVMNRIRRFIKQDVSVSNANVKAFLAMIRKAEGADYNTLYGGAKFSDYSKHPGYQDRYIVASGRRFRPSASGGYQFIYETWKRIADKLGLKDFTPGSQDRAAIELIAERGAYDYVLQGKFEQAVKKVSAEWASLPYSTANQNPKNLTVVKNYYLQNGGKIS